MANTLIEVKSVPSLQHLLASHWYTTITPYPSLKLRFMTPAYQYMSPTHSGFICLRHRFERASDYGDLDVKGAPESKVAMPFSAVLRVPYEGMMLLMGGTRRVVE